MNRKDKYSFISIITPVLNNVKDIEICLRSVADQTYIYKEHWIIDGGSTDGTLEIIYKYTSRYSHIKLVSEKDEGIYDAMNKGIERASGEWLYFLGSDDKLFCDTILESIFTEPETDNHDILYGNIQIKENGLIMGEPIDINGLKKTCTHHQATFIRKSVFDKLGKYNTKYSTCADWAFTIKCYQTKGLNIKYIDRQVAVYSTFGFSNTSNGHNPRLRDKNFNTDFIGLFEKFSLGGRMQLLMNDYLPKYLNPITYFRYGLRMVKKYFSRKV